MRNTNSIGMRPFEEVQRKATRAYTQNGQYHTIVESRVRLTPSRKFFLSVFGFGSCSYVLLAALIVGQISIVEVISWSIMFFLKCSLFYVLHQPISNLRIC